MASLVYADHNNATLSAATLNTIAAAAQMDPDVEVLVAGHSCGAVAEQVAKVANVKKVLHVDNEAYGNHLAENATGLVTSLQEQNKYSCIVGNATAIGKNLLPRVAAALDVQPLSDVIEVKGPDTFVRPVYAGNALATFKSNDPVRVVTIRGTCFEPAGEQDAAPIEVVDNSYDAGKSKFCRNELTVSERPDLSSAKNVVSGGRGLGSEENFAMLDTMADHLGAAVGASRAAVDAGYAANDMQVGQTGKVVAPELYVAVGISGAIQHLAGMKDSKTIVAINQDPEAAIFQVADYGLVGDLFKAVPEINEKLPAMAN